MLRSWTLQFYRGIVDGGTERTDSICSHLLRLAKPDGCAKEETKKEKSRPTPGLLSHSRSELGCAALAVQILALFLILATFFLLVLLAGLSALLGALTGLALLTLLTGLGTMLAGLPALLSTLLAVFFHIICHKIDLPFARLGALACCKNCFQLVARLGRGVGDEWRAIPI